MVRKAVLDLCTLALQEINFCCKLVPTNYRIKTKTPPTSVAKDDEDKNLGRWVNRQRSLYQAGKLRKDRQKSLEQVGLKWSMLATTSWESMFDTLCDYVDSKVRCLNSPGSVVFFDL